MTKERSQRADILKLIPYLGLIAVSLLAFSKEQRAYVHQRDEEFGIKTNRGGCQFPEPHKCNGDDATQVHHIIPQRYAKELGINPDFCENGITLCEYSHQNLIHPDMRTAKQTYHSNKNSYKDVFAARAEKLKHKKVYWQDKWDRIFHTTVVRSTQKAEEHGIYPPERNYATP